MTHGRRIIGCMSGTSMDGVDAAIVTIIGHGLGIECRFDRLASAPLGERDVLAALASGASVSAGEIVRARAAVCTGHAEAISALKPGAGIDLIVCHGQTVYHDPPHSWQLFDPWPLVASFGVPVLSDLRGADLSLGGQGAPITPLADWVLFRSDQVDRAVVNLGGFVNVTLVPRSEAHTPEGVSARDVCPCNHLLDAVARHRVGQPFDRDGERASRGQIDRTLMDDIAEVIEPSLSASELSSSPRSLGTGDEHADWIVSATASLSPDDALATVTGAIAGCVARATEHASEVFVAGGSVRNARLMTELRARCTGVVAATDALAVPAQAREAVCMAVLGALADDGIPIHLPKVTGARATLAAGSWSRP